MLKQLRKRFVSAAMLGMLIITVLVVGTINGINYYNTVSSVYSMLDLICYNGGSLAVDNNSLDYNIEEMIQKPQGEIPPGEGGLQPPEKPQEDNFPNMEGGLLFPEGKAEPYKERLGINDETPFITRFFVATIDSDKNIIDINMDNIASFTDEEAMDITNRLLEEKYGYGRDQNYFYLYEQNDEGSILIYLDSKRDMETCKGFLLVSLLVALVSLIVEIIILIILSKRVVKPVVESVEKQKEFITDASHELKTPLTIISANTEVLELTEGSNEWIDSIKNQTGRMTKLVNDMVFLAKMDEDGHKAEIAEFNLSDAVNEVVSAFEVVAKAKNVDFECICEDNIRYEGEEASIKELISILLDNAIKYVKKEGLIKVTCCRQGKKISLRIFNSYDNMEDNQLKQIFNRFYRIDKSRSRQTGGSGIGLSVAKAIVDKHEGMSIGVKNTELKAENNRPLNGDRLAEQRNGIEFVVIFK